jgi:hypothetical protein
MLARILGLALLILTLPMQGMAADGSMALQIGDSKLQAPVPEGYVRASEHAPAWFAGTAAALPPATRLVETLVASSDLKRMLMGESPQRPYLQIQVLRDAERVDFTMAEWTALQPVLVQQFGGFDLDRYTQMQQAGMGERMSAATGAEIEIAYGEVGKPVIYETRPTSLHFTLRLPITAQVNGQAQSLDVEAVGTAMLVGTKMVMANAYALVTPGQQPFTAPRAMVEPFVQRMQALNATPTVRADP